MKKIVLLLFFAPLALLAQSGNTGTASSTFMILPKPVHNEGLSSPVKVKPQQNAGSAVSHGGSHPRPAASAYTPAISTNIGTTVYDLQTNGSLAKRLQLYGNNKMSYVWIKSDDVTDAQFLTRYSGYNSFNGSSWLTPYGNTTDFEGQRCGWPSVGQVTTDGNTYELLTSHYAEATTAIYTGGIFWSKNSAVGTADFTRTIDLTSNRAATQGLLWPRMATSGNRIYMIGTYEDDRKISGVYNPIVYFCYNATTKQFESKGITLPGYDSTRYGTGSADEYSIDARGKYVAIVTGGFETDLALWKSSDSGKSFTKTIVNNFAAAPFDPKVDATFSDTSTADDRTCSVSLGYDGVAHVSYTPVRVVNLTTGDSSVNGYLSTGDNIVYWNDKDQVKVNVGGCWDYDKLGSISFNSGNNDENFAGYNHNFATFSNIAVDPSGNVYVVFSAPHEDDIDGNGNAFRHVYCSVFDASKDAWLPQQDIVQSWQEENVYATVARDADTKLHLVYMRDPNAGIFFPGTTNTAAEGTDTMVYEEVSTADLLANKVGLIDLGVNEKLANHFFSTGSIYPNPAEDKLTISLNLTHSATVTVKLCNMLGEEMQAQNYTMLAGGINNLQLSVSNLPAGVYLCNISAGGYTATERVVVER